MPKPVKNRKPHFHVAIFGSARITHEDPTYKLIFELASHIAKENMDIVTGGGPGVMEAANAGHQKGRGKNHNHLHSFGLNIKLSEWEQMSNRHLDIKKEFHRFSKRLDYFMYLSNAVVVAPGGVGTLLELAYTWQLTQVKQICNIPIILMGDMWHDLVKWVKKWPLKKGFMSPEDLQSVFFVKNPKQAIELLRRAHQEFKKGGKNFCINLKKYKVTLKP